MQQAAPRQGHLSQASRSPDLSDMSVTAKMSEGIAAAEPGSVYRRLLAYRET